MEFLIPTKFHLSQNYPNPFKDKTTIKYCIAFKTLVKITIYNSEGEMIEKLVDEVKQAGTYEVEFYPVKRQVITNPESNIRFQISSIGHQEPGVLFCQMKAGKFIVEKEMTLIQEENESVQTK